MTYIFYVCIEKERKWYCLKKTIECKKFINNVLAQKYYNSIDKKFNPFIIKLTDNVFGIDTHKFFLEDKINARYYMFPPNIIYK
jgi:hypothetical protein